MCCGLKHEPLGPFVELINKQLWQIILLFLASLKQQSLSMRTHEMIRIQITFSLTPCTAPSYLKVYQKKNSFLGQIFTLIFVYSSVLLGCCSVLSVTVAFCQLMDNNSVTSAQLESMSHS